MTGDYASLDRIVGGTDTWAGATGSFTSVGAFLPASGGSGRYEAAITTPTP